MPLTLSARLLAMPDGNLLHAFKAGEVTLAGLFVFLSYPRGGAGIHV